MLPTVLQTPPGAKTAKLNGSIFGIISESMRAFSRLFYLILEQFGNLAHPPPTQNRNLAEGGVGKKLNPVPGTNFFRIHIRVFANPFFIITPPIFFYADPLNFQP